MESYLKNILGLHVDIQTWDDSSSLPDDLRQNREFYVLTICGLQSLVIKEDATDFQISVYLKEKEGLKKYCAYPQVLCFERITSYQRKCLIESGQSFIVPDNQLYMPFIGIALQEHFKAQSVAGQQLTAMAQYILLYFIYDKTGEYHSKLDISKELDVNLMNISRGVQELEELNLLETKKKGRSSMVVATEKGNNLYRKAEDYLRDPVQKRLFVKVQDWMLDLPVSGQEAVEILNGNKDAKISYRTRAIEKRMYLDTSDSIESVDPAWVTDTEYIELEVWRYDPSRFSKDNIVDSISLELSTRGGDGNTVEVNI